MTTQKLSHVSYVTTFSIVSYVTIVIIFSTHIASLTDYIAR